MTRDGQGATTQLRGPAIYRHCSVPCRHAARAAYACTSKVIRQSQRWVRVLPIPRSLQHTQGTYYMYMPTSTCKSVSEIRPSQHQHKPTISTRALGVRQEFARSVAQLAWLNRTQLARLWRSRIYLDTAPPIAPPESQLASTSANSGLAGWSKPHFPNRFPQRGVARRDCRARPRQACRFMLLQAP